MVAIVGVATAQYAAINAPKAQPVAVTLGCRKLPPFTWITAFNSLERIKSDSPEIATHSLCANKGRACKYTSLLETVLSTPLDSTWLPANVLISEALPRMTVGLSKTN